MVPLCPSWGQGPPPAALGEQTPGSQSCQEEELDPRANGKETELGTLRQLHGGQTGRQTGDGVFGAWQTQGLIAELTPAPALEIQAGTMRQAWATPFQPSLGSPSFQGFRQGSHGQPWASLGLPGHFRGVGPANGTGPVGLRGAGEAAAHQTPLMPVPYPTWDFSTAWWGRGPESGPPPSGQEERPGWLGLRHLQPLVDTLGVELMVAGEDSEQLPRLEVAEADHTPGGRAESITCTLTTRAGSRQRTRPRSQRQEAGRELTVSAQTAGCPG